MLNGIIDSLKDSVLSQFSSEITVAGVLLALASAFVISLFIILVYRKTYSGIVYNRSMSLTFCLLSMITSLIIMTINSNLALSLGMVGALSIVRFRTAVKEPIDIAFMFWCICVGIMCGAGLYAYAALGSLGLGLLFYLLYILGVRPKTKFLLVVRFAPSAAAMVDAKMEALKNKNLKSQSASKDGMERTYEVQFAKNKEEAAFVADLQSVAGVETVNLVSYQNDFGF